jgi:mRNA-degrading endonuclease toxin of MazEF toxin-antitoxin module
MESPPMKPGEIFLGAFPFGDSPGVKVRPVLVLSPVTGPAAEVLVGYISSVIPEQLLPTDIVLDSATEIDRETHLKTRSVLRLHKLATIHRTSLPRFLGRLSPERFANALALLRTWLSL